MAISTRFKGLFWFIRVSLCLFFLRKRARFCVFGWKIGGTSLKRRACAFYGLTTSDRADQGGDDESEGGYISPVGELATRDEWQVDSAVKIDKEDIS